MSTTLGKIAPSITKLIRHGHTEVTAVFHKYELDMPADQKRALVNMISALLEIHARLEEELFYPALREVDPQNKALQEALPEHNEMKRLIGILREMEPGDADFDLRVNDLMRDVLHHVADEETVMLPAAELALKERLGDLGAEWTRRRVKMMAERAGEITSNAARGMPKSTMLLAGGMLAGGYLLKRAFESRRH
jgi:hemerythrin superfamily protein